jgi:hypothetical protein
MSGSRLAVLVTMVIVAATGCGRRKPSAAGAAGTGAVSDGEASDEPTETPPAADGAVDGGAEEATPADAHLDGDARGGDASDASPSDRGAEAPGGPDASDTGGGLSCLTGQILCNPYACDVATGRCKETCTGPADCAPGKACSPSGLCGVQVQATCAANDECASGFCAQGVCCTSACAGRCVSCALPSAVGTCTPVPAGAADPHGMCLSSQVCDGHGACVPKDAGTGA